MERYITWMNKPINIKLNAWNAPLDVVVLIGRDVDVLGGHGRKSRERSESQTDNGIVGKFLAGLEMQQRMLCLNLYTTPHIPVSL